MAIHATTRLKLYMLSTALLLAGAIIVDPTFLTPALLLLSLPVFSYIAIESNYKILKSIKVSGSVAMETGGRFFVEYTIINPTRIPILPVEFSIQYSELIKLVKGSKRGLLIIPPRAKVKLRFSFHGRLGEHFVGPLKIVLRDLFGFYRSSDEYLGKALVVNIPPTVEEVIVRKLLIYARSTGLVKSRIPGEGVEFYDIRDYSPGDEAKRIVWRIYASRRMLAIWEPEKEAFQPVLFILDGTREMWSGPMGQSMIEHSARIISSIIYYLVKRGYPVSATVFNESLVHTSGKPMHGYHGYMEALRALSKVRFEEGDESHRRRALSGVLSYMYTRILPRDRSIIFLFTHLRDTIIDEIAAWNNLYKDKGHILYIVHPLITAYESDSDVPEWVANIYRVKLIEGLREDMAVISRARGRGLKVIAVTPDLIPQRVMDIIERYSS
ncbi:DUF58 domain-containing protein [Desulfurococcus amylolyticus]|uniref:Uncharacterized protein n=1 Tax=Desulfurococcus amylolyticus DSM 16532 TaxID=768672 RepID=I3XRM6_DESAM|nr:DUF58 domain-containing protein [Desulfurococcus amylolyticus]AFL66600.1 protein of unknown function DUF58 [Desulfurococcus amylolyticus DSM 16532]